MTPTVPGAGSVESSPIALRNGRAVPLINGNNTNFSNPYSLNTDSSPGDQLTSDELLANSVTPPRTSQEWGTIFGVL